MKAKLSLLRNVTIVILSAWLVEQPFTVEAAPLTVRSPDQTHVAVVADSGRIQYRRTNDDKVERPFNLCDVQTLAFSRDGKLLAAAGGTNGCQAKIKVWRISELNPLCVILTPGYDVKTLALSTEGSFVMATDSDGHRKIWRVSDGALQSVKSTHRSADGKKLLIQLEVEVEFEVDPASGPNVTPPTEALKK